MGKGRYVLLSWEEGVEREQERALVLLPLAVWDMGPCGDDGEVEFILLDWERTMGWEGFLSFSVEIM